MSLPFARSWSPRVAGAVEVVPGKAQRRPQDGGADLGAVLGGCMPAWTAARRML